MFGDALAKKLILGRDAGFAVEFNEAVFFCHSFEFALNHRLIANERPVQIVRKRHIAAGFPITDGLSLAKFASESGFGSHVEPEGEVRAQSHGIEAAEIVAIDPADDTACDESKHVAIGKNNGPGFQSRNDAVLNLVEEV